MGGSVAGNERRGAKIKLSLPGKNSRSGPGYGNNSLH